MTNTQLKNQPVYNLDSAFTDIFSILRRYEVDGEKKVALAYSEDEQRILRQHIEHLVDVLLRGIQDMTLLFSVVDRECVDDVAVLIARCTNLVEALMGLRGDLD